MIEHWKTVPGFNRYEASNLGCVRSAVTKKIKSLDWSGRPWCKYPSVKIIDDSGTMRKILLHKVIYCTFVGDVPDGYQIDHRDRDRYNANLTNLQLLTFEENQAKRQFGNKIRELSIEEAAAFDAENSWMFGTV